MRGPRLLAVLALTAVAAFAWQRGRSPFLRIEAERELAARVAAEAGLDPVEVMALRELVGVDRDEAALGEVARRFVADRRAYGGSEALAAVAAGGSRAVADAVYAAAGRRVDEAERELRPRPEAVLAVRFRTVRERFASRLD
jgi:hypothetical protein